jgi:predicted nicotinamide N-methyase
VLSKLEMDEFWDIQLNGGTNAEISWIAPPEREQIIHSKDKDANSFSYEWISFHLPLLETTLNIRSIKSNVALLDSHVGEELWDAAKIFAVHLCISGDKTLLRERNNFEVMEGSCCGKRLRGKRILELGAGVGALGLCAALLGAKQVLCTDYDSDVLENLEFNLKHNMEVIYPLDFNDKPDGEIDEARLQWAKLDWRSHAGSDLRGAEWLTDQEEEPRNKIEQDFDTDIVIGSALVYSAQGALYCADTVKYFLIDKNAGECWILQMPGRPGFDRFLLRLEHWGLNYETFDIREDVFQTAAKYMGPLKSDIDDFKLFVIQKPKHLSK